MRNLEGVLQRIRSLVDDLTAGYVEQDDRLNQLAENLAEQNLRVLFLLQHSTFKVKRKSDILISGDAPVTSVNGYQLYMQERDNFLTKLQSEMQIAAEALKAAEAQESVDGQGASVGEGDSPASGTGDEPPSAGPADIPDAAPVRPRRPPRPLPWPAA